MGEIDDSYTDSVRVSVTAEDIEHLRPRAVERYRDQMRILPHLGYQRSSEESNLVGLLGELALRRHLAAGHGLGVRDISDTAEGTSGHAGDVAVYAPPGASPARADSKTSRYRDWPTYGRRLVRSQLDKARFDAYVWALVADDPYRARHVDLIGWLSVTQVRNDVAASDGTGRVDPSRATTRMRQLDTLPGWLRRRALTAPPPPARWPPDFFTRRHDGTRIVFGPDGVGRWADDDGVLDW